MKRLLVLVTFLSYALLAFSQSDNPNKPTWWNKYQYLAKHGTSGNGGTSNSLSVGSNVDASNECGPQSETYIAINPSHSRSLAGGSNEIFRLPMRGYFSTDDGGSWEELICYFHRRSRERTTSGLVPIQAWYSIQAAIFTTATSWCFSGMVLV